MQTKVRAKGGKFQSLFLWNSLSDGNGKSVIMRMRSKFQSLFLWNSLSDKTP